MTDKKIEAAMDEVKSLYPVSRPISLPAEKTDLEAWQKLHLATQIRDRWEERVNSLKLHLMSSMKEADELVDGDNVLATWKNCTRSDLDRKRLKEDHPELYQKYTSLFPTEKAKPKRRVKAA